MRRSLRLYAQFARCSFQRHASYRLANWSGIVVNFFFFLIHAQVYLAFFGSRAEVAGWRPDEAVRYFATSEALLMVLGVFLGQTGGALMERIRDGQVSADLARPITLLPREVAERMGSAAYYLLTRAIVLYTGAALLYGLVPPFEPALLVFPVSLVLGVAVNASLAYLANATAFWTELARGPLGLLMILSSFFGGLVVPLDFYPGPVRAVCDALPFRAGLYTPVALASGRIEGGALAFGLLHQVVWLTVLVLVARAVEARGVRRLVVHGG